VCMHAAARCSTLQHAAARCSTLQHTTIQNIAAVICFCVRVRVCVIKCACVYFNTFPIYCNTLQTHSTTHGVQYSGPHCNTATLQHTATHYSSENRCSDMYMIACASMWDEVCACALRHTPTYCITRQHTVTHGNTLQHTATHCNTLKHTAAHCNTLQHTALQNIASVIRAYVRVHAHVCEVVCVCVHFNTLQHTAYIIIRVSHQRTHVGTRVGSLLQHVAVSLLTRTLQCFAVFRCVSR